MELTYNPFFPSILFQQKSSSSDGFKYYNVVYIENV